MSAEIVNLRRARKAKLRSEKEQRAAENRVRHGLTKAERQAAEAEASRATSTHIGHLRDGADRRDIGKRRDSDASNSPREPDPSDEA